MSHIINPYRHAAVVANGLLTGLESYWKLDEASGTILDSHGSNDGTLTGATYGATGVINDAIDFDGTGDYITISDVLDFDYNEPFSIQCWYKPNSASTDNHFLVAKQESGGNFRGYALWRGGSGQNHRLLFELVSTPSNLLSFKGTTQLTNTSKWYHIVATYDGSDAVSGMTLYIDGSSESSTGTTDSLSTTTVNAVDLVIGARGTGQETDGVLDEVGIWSRELSASDVTTLYNSGSGTPYGDFTS